MRSIKFRAWDEINQWMIYMTLEELLYWYDQHGVEFPEAKKRNDISAYSFSLKTAQDEKIMQCTGLKDKNDKEIYEGDIVDLPITDTCEGGGCCSSYIKGENGCSGHMRRVVEWINAGFIINPHGSDHSVEVIGNIYENPNLLIPKSDEEL